MSTFLNCGVLINFIFFIVQHYCFSLFDIVFVIIVLLQSWVTCWGFREYTHMNWKPSNGNCWFCVDFQLTLYTHVDFQVNYYEIQPLVIYWIVYSYAIKNLNLFVFFFLCKLSHFLSSVCLRSAQAVKRLGFYAS